MPENLTGMESILQLKKMVKELAEVLFAERDLIVGENFKEYPELVSRKEKLIDAINDTVSDIDFEHGEEQKELRVLLKELLEVNRGNMFLLYSYRIYHKEAARLLCLEETGKKKKTYVEKSGGSFFDTQV